MKRKKARRAMSDGSTTEQPKAVTENGVPSVATNGAPIEPPEEPREPQLALPENEPVSPLEALEYRVIRLERTLVSLQDTQIREKRVVERLATEEARRKAKEEAVPPPSPVAIAQFAVPEATVAPPSDQGSPLAQAVPAQALTEGAPVAMVAPVASVAPVAAVAMAQAAESFAAGSSTLGKVVAPLGWFRSWWIIFETLGDLRVMKRMFGDPRFKMSWTGRLLPPCIILFILFSHLIWPWNALPLIGNMLNGTVGPILDKAIDLVLAFVAYKILMHEVARYRQTIPDAPGAVPFGS